MGSFPHLFHSLSFKPVSLPRIFPKNNVLFKMQNVIWRIPPCNSFHSTVQALQPLVGTKTKTLQHISGKGTKRKSRVPSPYWKPTNPNQRDAHMAMVDPV